MITKKGLEQAYKTFITLLIEHGLTKSEAIIVAEGSLKDGTFEGMVKEAVEITYSDQSDLYLILGDCLNPAKNKI